MEGFWLGPTDPMSFLNTFIHAQKKIPDSKLSGAAFGRIPSQPSSELQMSQYESFVSTIQHLAYLCMLNQIAGRICQKAHASTEGPHLEDQARRYGSRRRVYA